MNRLRLDVPFCRYSDASGDASFDITDGYESPRFDVPASQLVAFRLAATYSLIRAARSCTKHQNVSSRYRVAATGKSRWVAR